MGPLGVRDALGGTWWWSTTGALVILVPGTLVVAVQEASLLRASNAALFTVIVVSSLVQSAAAGVVTAALAALFRQRWHIIPISALVAVWIVIGVVRGLSGAAVAVSMTGEGATEIRVFTWVVVSLVWMPLLSYTAAQIEHRRRLLAELAELQRSFARETARSRLTAAELRDSLVVAIGDRIRPIIDEIRRALESVAGRGDVGALEVIGTRLSAVSDDALHLLDPPTERETEPLTGVDPRPARASVAAALAVELRVPGRAALLSGAAIVPALVPVALTPRGLESAVDAVLGLAVLVAVLYLTALLRRRLIHTPRFTHGAVAIASYLAAGLSGSASVVVFEAGRPSPVEVIIAAVLPIASVVSASCVTLAVGIGIANQELLAALSLERTRVAKVRRRTEFRDAQVRDQLTLLLHGPVQGRLSACVMALNFHLASRDAHDDARTATITAAVVDHLAAASRDLDALSHLSSRTGVARLD